MSLKKKALSGVFWTTLQQFGTQGVGFIVSVILARLLMPSEFGLIAMLGIFMGLGTALVNGGMTQSLIRTQNPDEDDFSTVFYFNLAGSLIIYGIIFFTAPLIAAFYDQELLTNLVRVYAVTIIINAFGAVQLTRLTKIMDFKTQLKVSLPSTILSGITGISMAYFGFGVWSLVGAAIVQATAGTIQLWYWSKWTPLWRFSKAKFGLHFHYGVQLMLSGLLDILFTNVYTIVIGKFFAPAQVGFYNRANTLQMLPVGNVSSIVTKVSFPLFSSIQDEDKRLKSVYKRIMKLVIFLITPILIIMAVTAEPLFRFLFTEKWLPAVPYFQILCVNGILFPIHSYNLQILKVKGRSDLFLRLEVIKKVIIAVVLVISFQFGIYGLLYGSVISSILCFFINTHYSGKFLSYSAWEQTKDLLPIITLSLVMGAIVYLLDEFFLVDLSGDVVRLFVSGIFGVLIYTILGYLLRFESLFEIINIVKNNDTGNKAIFATRR
ncbi:lipopolysaccharide biosynthesis protein [Robertkochia flava]|uniref:lipopolysaccharide biosynthesis protein n=1 Tax=Robertkochia flava TaxID=3447986 RepID=UPI001CCF7347|nr:lipopolysaccharide biosynthesis protein [Robertkochia marina]